LLINHDLRNDLSYFIVHWFQPIYHLINNNVIGYEALLRDASSPKTPPVKIFMEADKNDNRNILDLISIKTAIDAYKDESSLLFLNIFPSTILKKDFLSWWDIHVPSSTAIVLELLESEPIMDWEELKMITKELQTRGIKIAVDDMGTGYSSFQQWIELEPDFIKLDRYFVKDLSANSRKQDTVRSLLSLFSGTTKVISEGIETIEDLYSVKQLGVSYAQGYFLGMPSPKENLFID
jgi:EAL domain-containing protein (putative c-di-GMP-specific phosphodiesterase class I)